MTPIQLVDEEPNILSSLREENDRQRAELKAREKELLRLEADSPGISRVRRDADGSVILDND